MGEGDQNEQNCSYKINKLGVYDIQHGNNSQ